MNTACPFLILAEYSSLLKVIVTNPVWFSPTATKTFTSFPNSVLLTVTFTVDVNFSTVKFANVLACVWLLSPLYTATILFSPIDNLPGNSAMFPVRFT